MEWRDEGLVIGVRRHGEHSAIVEAMTKSHGRHFELVRANARSASPRRFAVAIRSSSSGAPGSTSISAPLRSSF